MYGRFGSLTFSIVFAWMLTTPGLAYAHRLEADYRVLPGGQVEVEAWFDLTRDSPRGARVQVLRPDGSGGHQFSDTLASHADAVTRYHRAQAR